MKERKGHLCVIITIKALGFRGLPNGKLKKELIVEILKHKA